MGGPPVGGPSVGGFARCFRCHQMMPSEMSTTARISATIQPHGVLSSSCADALLEAIAAPATAAAATFVDDVVVVVSSVVVETVVVAAVNVRVVRVGVGVVVTVTGGAVTVCVGVAVTVGVVSVAVVSVAVVSVAVVSVAVVSVGVAKVGVVTVGFVSVPVRAARLPPATVDPPPQPARTATAAMPSAAAITNPLGFAGALTVAPVNRSRRTDASSAGGEVPRAGR